MSTSKVAMGAPCATAANPPTRMNWMSVAASRSSSVVRSAASVICRTAETREAGPQLGEHTDGPVVQLQPLPNRHCQGGLEKTHVEGLTLDVIRPRTAPRPGFVLADRHV